jgi:probable HAF family extracellular repeat protein
MIPVNGINLAAFRRLLSVGVLAIFLTVAGAGPVYAQSGYTLTDLGTLGYTTTVAYGIDTNAAIVGRSYLTQTVPGSGCSPRHTCLVHLYHGFIYTAGLMVDLGTLGGAFSDARAVNGNGDVVGFSTLTGTSLSTQKDAFLYRAGHMTDLGTLGGPGSRAYAINNYDEVVGDAFTASLQDHAFLYSAGKMTDLGTLGGTPSTASGINNVHQVVGSSEVANGSGMHAFLWNSGKMIDLGTLGGSQSMAYAINDAGQVVGYASPPNSSVHAFLYSGGKMIDLGVLFDSSVAEAINSSGVVVGTADVLVAANTQSHAFIYSGGKMQDLNNLIPPGSGWVLSEATGINDKGQIVCNAFNATTGAHHAFLLTPQ